MAHLNRILRHCTVRLRAAPEEGAQAAEYAMVGGAGAAACTALYMALKDPAAIGRVVRLIMDFLARAIGSWA